MKQDIDYKRTPGLFIPLIILALCLYDASWAYPSDYFVDQGHRQANDANPGSGELPLKTIMAAAAKAKAGDTILIAAGTYREMIFLEQSGTSTEHPITFRALPGAEVMIKGSDLVSGWIPHNRGIWKKTGWGINSQQVFVDGNPLQQIGETCPLSLQRFLNKPLLPPVGKGLKDMQPGTFFFSEKDNTLLIRLKDDSDPNDHLVEASVRDFILPPMELNYITLEKLNFSHSNLTSKGLIMGMVNVWGNFWTISNCTFNHGDFAGISIIGEGHEITNSKFNNNGNLGISINGSDEAHKWGPVPNRPPQNIILSGNETSYNNYRKFELNWQHGGIKAAVSCNGVTVTNHKTMANYGAGIWFDLYCRNIIISRSTATKNIVGIGYEISDQAVIANNIVTGNEYHGIYVAASNDVLVENNTLDDNGFGIVVHGLPRPEHPTLNNNRVINNIISESRLVDLIFYKNAVTARGNRSDYNLYSRRDKGVKISWTANQGYGVTHTNLRAFATASGQETNSLTGDPLWINREAGDFTLKTGSPALCAGVANAKGVAEGNLRKSNASRSEPGCGNAKINIGAF